jgi:16S rRNA (guanine966-N2)-methyltransferase
MRIISGQARGRRLVTPPGYSTRPTTDRVRESLFSILGNLEGVTVVDGFAGSGALGCEALSRGARRCYFFDKAVDAIESVRENTRRIGADRRAVIRKCSFDYGLEHHVQEEIDLWFLDPPYGTDLARKSLDAMAHSPHVTEGALVVVECDEADAIASVEGFALEDDRVYGRTRLLFYRRRLEGQGGDLDAAPPTHGEEPG